MSATHPAAAGPPRAIDATMGAIDVLTIVPRGILNGSADAKRVTTIQNARPSDYVDSGTSLDRCRALMRIRASTGNTRARDHKRKRAHATSPAM